jgi:hypothetical protein
MSTDDIFSNPVSFQLKNPSTFSLFWRHLFRASIHISMTKTGSRVKASAARLVGSRIGVVICVLVVIVATAAVVLPVTQMAQGQGSRSIAVPAVNTSSTSTAPTSAPAAATNSVHPWTGAPQLEVTSSSPAPMATTTAAPTFPLCDVDPNYKIGFVSIIFGGIHRNFTSMEGLELQVKFKDSYNGITGGCADIFQRFLQNATMTEQILNQSESLTGTLETQWEAWVRCNSCPDQNPLFSRTASSRRLAENFTSVEFPKFLEVFDRTIAKTTSLPNQVFIFGAEATYTDGKVADMIFPSAQPLASPGSLAPSLRPTSRHPSVNPSILPRNSQMPSPANLSPVTMAPTTSPRAPATIPSIVNSPASSSPYALGRTNSSSGTPTLSTSPMVFSPSSTAAPTSAFTPSLTSSPMANPSTEYSHFTSSFYVEYGGPSGIFQGAEIVTVQNVLRNTYNEVQGLDKSIILDDVKIAEQTFFPASASTRVPSGISQGTPPTRAPTKSYSLTNYCTVSGKCRSCTSGTKLFNDALRRRLQVSANSFNHATLTNLHDAGINDVTSVTVSNDNPLLVSQNPSLQPSPRPSQLPTANTISQTKRSRRTTSPRRVV